jgi:hypothetical protein
VFSNFDAVVLKGSAQLHGTGEFLWSLARLSHRYLDDMMRDDRPPVILNLLHPRTKYRSRPSWIALDRSQPIFAPQWPIHSLVQSMCCIAQTLKSQKGINTAAPPASQNLVKGGST